MSCVTYDFRAGNTLPTLKVKVLDSNTKQIIPLDTLFTANLIWKIDTGPTITKAMNVLTGADDGFVEYQFLSGELVAGTMTAIVELTEIATGKTTSTVKDIIREVGPSL